MVKTIRNRKTTAEEARINHIERRRSGWKGSGWCCRDEEVRGRAKGAATVGEVVLATAERRLMQ